MKERHKQILEFVKKFIEDNGYSPTIREISEGIGLKSTSNTFWHVQKMKELGLLRGPETTPRSITVPGMEQNGLYRKEVYVLHGYWSMPGEDGVNVWGVSEDLEYLQKRMSEVGKEMVEEAKGPTLDIEFDRMEESGTKFEAEDMEGNYIRLYITSHEVEKGRKEAVEHGI